MVRAKSNQELTFMRKAGIIVALAHRAASAAMRAGITTKEVNDIVEDVIRKTAESRLLRVCMDFRQLPAFL